MSGGSGSIIIRWGIVKKNGEFLSEARRLMVGSIGFLHFAGFGGGGFGCGFQLIQLLLKGIDLCGFFF